MNNQYADPQIFALMESNYNMSTVGKFIYNIKEFDSEQFLLDKKCDRVTFNFFITSFNGYNKMERQ